MEGAGACLPLLETNDRLAVRRKWPGVVAHAHADIYACGRLNTNWSVANDRTVEWRVDTNLVLTARVFDKDNQEAVRYHRTFVGTQQVDHTLSTGNLFGSVGHNLGRAP